MADERVKIPFRSSVPVALRRPTDVFQDDPLNNTDDGSVSTFRVYDPSVDEVLSEDVSIAGTTWEVTSAGLFKVGDIVELTMNDLDLHFTTITVVTEADGTITVDTGPTVAADEDRRCRVALGPEVAMAEFGTPKAGDDDWGFVGTLSSTYPGLTIGRDVDINIFFVGAVAGGLDLLEIICATVTDPCEET